MAKMLLAYQLELEFEQFLRILQAGLQGEDGASRYSVWKTSPEGAAVNSYFSTVSNVLVPTSTKEEVEALANRVWFKGEDFALVEDSVDDFVGELSTTRCCYNFTKVAVQALWDLEKKDSFFCPESVIFDEVFLD